MDLFRSFYHLQRQSSQVSAIRKLDNTKYHDLNLYCMKQINNLLCSLQKLIFGTDISPGWTGLQKS